MDGMRSAGPPPPSLDAAWDEFSTRLRRWLERRVAQPADAEDLLQQVFLRLAQRPPPAAGPAQVGAWLWRVARNALVDHYRRRARFRSAPLDPEEATAEEEDSFLALARCLRPLLAQLPPRYGDAVRDADLEGRPQAELARQAGVTVSAMKSRVQRGRRMLQDLLRRCCGVRRDARTGRILGAEGGVECGACDRAPR